MRVVYITVVSINGKVTMGMDPDVSKWTSPEDKKHFRAKLAEAEVVIGSSATYPFARKGIKEGDSRRFVFLTRDPEKYAGEKHSAGVEFTNETPEDLIRRLKKEGVKDALLTTGPTLSSLFLARNLVDEIHLTIEPVVFGEGSEMLANSDYTRQFRLTEQRRLNDAGTVLLVYTR